MARPSTVMHDARNLVLVQGYGRNHPNYFYILSILVASFLRVVFKFLNLASTAIFCYKFYKCRDVKAFTIRKTRTSAHCATSGQHRSLGSRAGVVGTSGTFKYCWNTIGSLMET